MPPADPTAAPSPARGDPRMEALAAFYEALAPATLDRLDRLYAPNGRFVDPFNDVVGHAPIRRIFEHMFATLDAPRFKVLEAVAHGPVGFLLWTFTFRRRGQAAEHRILGATHLRFDAEGRITLHHDHWDPARQLYEGVPVLGALMRWLRRRLSAAA
jgi:steroid delta-isomerase